MGNPSRISQASRQQARESESPGTHQLRKSFSRGVEWPETLSGCRETLSSREGKHFGLNPRRRFGSLVRVPGMFLAARYLTQSSLNSGRTPARLERLSTSRPGRRSRGVLGGRVPSGAVKASGVSLTHSHPPPPSLTHPLISSS